MAESSVTVRAKGVTAVYAGNGRWAVAGRGPKRMMTHDEVLGVLNSRGKKKGADGKQSR